LDVDTDDADRGDNEKADVAVTAERHTNAVVKNFMFLKKVLMIDTFVVRTNVDYSFRRWESGR